MIGVTVLDGIVAHYPVLAAILDCFVGFSVVSAVCLSHV